MDNPADAERLPAKVLLAGDAEDDARGVAAMTDAPRVVEALPPPGVDYALGWPLADVLEDYYRLYGVEANVVYLYWNLYWAAHIDETRGDS